MAQYLPSDQLFNKMREKTQDLDTAPRLIELNMDDKKMSDNTDYFDDLLDNMQVTEAKPSDVQIHVCPDMRYALINFIHCFKLIEDNLVRSKMSKVSKPLVLGYCMAQMDVFRYMNDKYRTVDSESRYTRSYSYNDDKRALIEHMAHQAVPDFVAHIMKNLSATRLSIRQNVNIAMTSKGWDEQIDFGRSFPIGIFIQIHNIIANRDEDDTISMLWEKIWMAPVCFTGDYTIRIGNYFGIMNVDGFPRAQYSDNKLFRHFTHFLEDALGMDEHKRKNLIALPFEVPVFSYDPNFYDYELSYTPENFNSMLNFTQECAAWLELTDFGEETVLQCIDHVLDGRLFVCGYIKLNHQHGIIIRLYMPTIQKRFQLPTWLII